MQNRDFKEQLLWQAGLNSSNKPQLAEAEHFSRQIFSFARWASCIVKWLKELSHPVKYLSSHKPLYAFTDAQSRQSFSYTVMH